MYTEYLHAYTNIIHFILDNSDVEGMRSRMSLLLKFSVLLAGISNVLEVLDSSFRSSHSAQLEDLHNLHEGILKIKQVQFNRKQYDYQSSCFSALH